jgi:hypothetical protein
MKIRPVVAELFYAGTEGHDETNSRFSQFCERAQKSVSYRTVNILSQLQRPPTVVFLQDSTLCRHESEYLGY